MRLRRFLQCGFVSCLLLSASVPCAFAISYDEIVDKGEIAVAVYRDFHPFSYRENGRLVGIDVDIAHHIAREMGVRLNLIEQTADESVDDDLRNVIWKGHYLGGQLADIMLHVPYDREFSLRNDMVFFFGAYFEERVGLAWDPGQVGELANIAVFRFNKVGVELDTLADFYLASAMGGSIVANVVHFPDTRKATDALLAGEVAGVAGPMSQLEAGIDEQRADFRTGTVPMPGLMKNRWLLGAAVKHTYRQLGYAVADILAAMVADGTMKRIFAEHGVAYAPPPQELVGATAQ